MVISYGGAADALDIGIEQSFLFDKRFGDSFKKQFIAGEDALCTLPLAVGQSH